MLSADVNDADGSISESVMPREPITSPTTRPPNRMDRYCEIRIARDIRLIMPCSLYLGSIRLVFDQACIRSGLHSIRNREAGISGATSVLIHGHNTTSFLPHDDADAALAFYRDLLGFEVRLDVGYEGLRWITVGPPGQPDTSIVLTPPAVDPGITDDERRLILEMMAKGTYAGLQLATRDLDGTFEKLQAADADVVQEPTEQPYGLRDFAVRDPAGNLLRIQQVR